MEKVEACLLEAKFGSVRGTGWPCGTRPPHRQSCLQHPGMGDEAWERRGLGKISCLLLGNFCRVFGLLSLLKNLPRKIHVSLILSGVFEGEEGKKKTPAAISCLMADSALGRMCVSVGLSLTQPALNDE